jgi:hypothetical protein
MPIYSRLEAIASRVYGDKVMPIVINKLGVDCEIFRGSKTTDEFSFYGTESRHSPLTFASDEAVRFYTRLMITGNEIFYVSGYDIGSSVNKAKIYSYKWVRLLPNDHVKVLRNNAQERWFRILDPEMVGMTTDILDNRYYAVSVEGLE